jgi:hypothetical protein
VCWETVGTFRTAAHRGEYRAVNWKNFRCCHVRSIWSCNGCSIVPQFGQVSRPASQLTTKSMRLCAAGQSTDVTAHGEVRLRACVKSFSIPQACPLRYAAPRAFHTNRDRARSGKDIDSGRRASIALKNLEKQASLAQ